MGRLVLEALHLLDHFVDARRSNVDQTERGDVDAVVLEVLQVKGFQILQGGGGGGGCDLERFNTIKKWMAVGLCEKYTHESCEHVVVSVVVHLQLQNLVANGRNQ